MNNTSDIKDKAIAVVELFERLLDCKGIDIPCSDEEEQLTRYEEGNCARIYGIEYYNLVDDVMNVIYEPTNSTKTTNGFKSILEEAGRYESSIEILNYVIKYLNGQDSVIYFVDNDDEVKCHVDTCKCKDQAAQILKVITDEVIIDKDDLVGKLDEIYLYINTDADIMLHEYARHQSYQIKPVYNIEDIRSYLVLANLIIYLNIKNDIDPDKSWSVPEGWKYRKEK